MQTLTNCWPSGGETEKCNVNWNRDHMPSKQRVPFEMHWLMQQCTSFTVMALLSVSGLHHTFSSFIEVLFRQVSVFGANNRWPCQSASNQSHLKIIFGAPHSLEQISPSNSQQNPATNRLGNTHFVLVTVGCQWLTSQFLGPYLIILVSFFLFLCEHLLIVVTLKSI